MRYSHDNRRAATKQSVDRYRDDAHDQEHAHIAHDLPDPFEAFLFPDLDDQQCGPDHDGHHAKEADQAICMEQEGRVRVPWRIVLTGHGRTIAEEGRGTKLLISL